jgi:type IV pilus modification protein PilV
VEWGGVEMNRQNNRCRGFSLLEVMIAMIVLTIGLLAVVALFETGMKALQSGNKMTLAAGLAKNKMDSLRESNVTLLSNGEDHSEGMTRTWSIRKSERDSRLWIIEVDVVWRNALNQYQTVSLKSLAFF